MRNVTQIRRFYENDILKLCRRADVLIPEDRTFELVISASAGYTYTFLVNGESAAVAGINIMWEGVAQVWAISSDLIRQHGVFYTKGANEILLQFAKLHKIRRYHTIVDGSNVENIRWLNLLKFTYEFCMQRAAPNGADVFGYVRWEVKNVIRTKRAQTRLQKHVEELLGMD